MCSLSPPALYPSLRSHCEEDEEGDVGLLLVISKPGPQLLGEFSG